MTVPVQTPVTSSVANGVTTVFPFTFKILNAADLTVTVDGAIVTTGFTVTGVGEDAGGTVVFDVAPANNKKIVRYLNPVLARVIDYQQFGDWLAEIVNADFDRIWLTIQAITQSQLISIKLPIDTTTEQIINEDAAARAGKLLGFDEDGDVVAKDPTELVPDLNDAVQDAIDAAASANSSANIATAAATAAATTPVAAPTHAATSKATPVDLDELPLIDSAASFGLKRLTWANLKATLKTYFDTLYNNVVVANGTNDPTFASTSNTDAVSPEWFRALTKFTKEYVSSEQTITSAGLLTLSHGLGAVPKMITTSLVCKTAEAGYAVNDIVEASLFYDGNARPTSIVKNSTNISVRYGNDASVFSLPNKTTGATTTLTNANWRLVISAWA